MTLNPEFVVKSGMDEYVKVKNLNKNGKEQKKGKKFFTLKKNESQ